MKKRIAMLVLALSMVATACPMSVYAQEMGVSVENNEEISALSVAGSSLSDKAYADTSSVKMLRESLENDKKALSPRDVSPEDWFASAVDFMYKESIMRGKGETEVKDDEIVFTFAPYDITARAEVATVFSRLDETGGVKLEKDSFPDVSKNDWFYIYTPYILEKGYMTGYTDGRFGGYDVLTREQFAKMLYNYVRVNNLDETIKGDLAKYSDKDWVSDFAKEPMQWAVGAGIIKGKDEETRLDPQGGMTRAEMAVMLERFLQVPDVKKFSKGNRLQASIDKYKEEVKKFQESMNQIANYQPGPAEEAVKEAEKALEDKRIQEAEKRLKFDEIDSKVNKAFGDLLEYRGKQEDQKLPEELKKFYEELKKDPDSTLESIKERVASLENTYLMDKKSKNENLSSEENAYYEAVEELKRANQLKDEIDAMEKEIAQLKETVEEKKADLQRQHQELEKSREMYKNSKEFVENYIDSLEAEYKALMK